MRLCDARNAVINEQYSERALDLDAALNANVNSIFKQCRVKGRHRRVYRNIREIQAVRECRMRRPSCSSSDRRSAVRTTPLRTISHVASICRGHAGQCFIVFCYAASDFELARNSLSQSLLAVVAAERFVYFQSSSLVEGNPFVRKKHCRVSPNRCELSAGNAATAASNNS